MMDALFTIPQIRFLDSLPRPGDMILVSISLLLLGRALYRTVFSPLASIPGPWQAKISGLYIVYETVRLRKSRTIHALFAEYGPVVRIGPNQVAVQDADAARLIGDFPKDEMYAGFNIMGGVHTFAALTSEDHWERRHATLPHYTPLNMARRRSDILDAVSQLMSFIHDNPQEKALDMLQVLQHLMIDITVASVLGVRAGALDGLRKNQHHILADAVSDCPKEMTLRAAMPTVVWAIARRWPNERWRRFCDSEAILYRIAAQRLQELGPASSWSPDSEDEPARDRSALMGRLISYIAQHKQTSLDRDAIVVECAGHFIAGVETSSTTLSFALWELSRRPDVVRRIRDELSDKGIHTATLEVHGLQYLSAVVKEVLRLYSAVLTLLQRVVPEGPGIEINGHTLPPGVRVGAQAWTMHRHPFVFPDPEQFDPDRWLEEQPAQKARFIPFGLPGQRECIGKHLATMVMEMVIAGLVLNFDIVAMETEESMYLREAFSTFPAGRKAMFRFLPLD